MCALQVYKYNLVSQKVAIRDRNVFIEMGTNTETIIIINLEFYIQMFKVHI